MKIIKIKKGLNIPMKGIPQQSINNVSPPKKVALIGHDYIGMKPKFSVSVNDKVKLGQELFIDKKNPSVKFTSPGGGKVVSINRGERRIFESIIIEIDSDNEEIISFPSYSREKIKTIPVEKIKENLLNSGLWTSLRTRPYSKTPNPESVPSSIFITAIDTNPLAPSVTRIIEGKEEAVNAGLYLASRLTEGKIYLCTAPDLELNTPRIDTLEIVKFTGPHPSGNVGTHIHFLNPVHRHKTVWHLNIQDLIAIGNLFITGKLPAERILSLAGPRVKNPRLIRTRPGAFIPDIISDQVMEGKNRIISGSILNGRTSREPVEFLGRYHQQISVIEEYDKKEIFGWIAPGINKYSVKNLFFAKLLNKKEFNFNSSAHGGERAIFPIESYEKVMPLDILPTFLLRSLVVEDIEENEKLGALELDEEDLALCTFVSASKLNYGSILRKNLTTLEKEG